MTDQSAMAKALIKDPDWEYGEILPMATRKGERTWAIPDYLRAPLQSWVKLMDSMGTGQIQTREGTEELMPDILNVAPIPGAATSVGANMVRRGALGEETRSAPEAIRYIYGHVADAMQPMAERLAQRRERRAQAGSPAGRDGPPSRPQNGGPVEPGVFRPPPRSESPDVDGILSEIDELSKMIASQSERVAANADEISQLQYSQNRQRLRQNPGSLTSRLERGPTSYSPPPDRRQPMPPAQGDLSRYVEDPRALDQGRGLPSPAPTPQDEIGDKLWKLKLDPRHVDDPRIYAGRRGAKPQELQRMKMAMGEFNAAMEKPVEAFRAGRISQKRLEWEAKKAAEKASQGNKVQREYLLKRLDVMRQDEFGWGSMYPDKKD